jgi:hypothetical protein
LVAILSLTPFSLSGCSGAEPRGGQMPLATPPPTPSSDVCHSDVDCTVINNCGCSCEAGLAPAPAMACSEACPGDPCIGKRAVCRSGQCVIEAAVNEPTETS